MSRVLRPTLTCFDDALDYCEARARVDRSAVHHLIVVHAIVTRINPHPEEPQHPFSHAWVEEAGMVITAFLLNGEKVYYRMTRAQHDELFIVIDETRYTMPDALLHNLRSGHYGPWEERYRKLAKGG